MEGRAQYIVTVSLAASYINTEGKDSKLENLTQLPPPQSYWLLILYTPCIKVPVFPKPPY